MKKIINKEKKEKKVTTGTCKVEWYQLQIVPQYKTIIKYAKNINKKMNLYEKQEI